VDVSSELSGSVSDTSDLISANSVPEPPSLCRWSIHKEELWDVSEEQDSELDPPSDYLEELACELENNNFSDISAEKMPIDIHQIVKAVQRSPKIILLEALGFSIISRNIQLVQELCEDVRECNLGIGDLYPFHLATSYLDGSGTCCLLLDVLIRELPERSLTELYVNELNHTVLDNLMISILKSHTSLPPEAVDSGWRHEKGFAGQEVDVCGRWDADSECVRLLQAHQDGPIPLAWKHKFCHTSAQTICHCINTLFHTVPSPNIDAVSGLFLKRCSKCGHKLQLYPLHTLILTALAVAQQNHPGEDLFGILACLLCLLYHGANPFLTAPISFSALLDRPSTEQCDHKKMDPAELARRLATSYFSTWPDGVRTGWQILCFVLQSSRTAWTIRYPRLKDRHENSKSRPGRSNSGERSHIHDKMDLDHDITGTSETGSDDINSDEAGIDNEGSMLHINDSFRLYCCLDNPKGNFFGSNGTLGTLWAAIQTELLTYRRRTQNDPWISDKFDMCELHRKFSVGGQMGIRLVKGKMMKTFCTCGTFHYIDTICVTEKQACAFRFTNLEDWYGTTFLSAPSRVKKWSLAQEPHSIEDVLGRLY
jgi:hypothetical protein